MNPHSAPADGSPIPAASSVGAGPDAAGADRVAEAAAPAVLPAVAERSAAEPLQYAVAERSEAEPPNYVPVRAMEDVMRVRAQQIFQHGHTPESDAALPLYHFARQLHFGATGIVEGVQFRQDKSVLRRRLVKLAAMCLAMIDRIDADPLLSSPLVRQAKKAPRDD